MFLPRGKATSRPELLNYGIGLLQPGKKRIATAAVALKAEPKYSARKLDSIRKSLAYKDFCKLDAGTQRFYMGQVVRSKGKVTRRKDAQGVWRCTVTPDDMTLDQLLPVDFPNQNFNKNTWSSKKKIQHEKRMAQVGERFMQQSSKDSEARKKCTRGLAHELKKVYHKGPQGFTYKEPQETISRSSSHDVQEAPAAHAMQNGWWGKEAQTQGSARQ